MASKMQEGSNSGPPRLIRTTRSGRSFSIWNGPCVDISREDLDFEALLKSSIDAAHLREQRACLKPGGSARNFADFDSSDSDQESCEDSAGAQAKDTHPPISQSSLPRATSFSSTVSSSTPASLPSSCTASFSAPPPFPPPFSAPASFLSPPEAAPSSKSPPNARKLRRRAASHKQRRDARNREKEKTFGGQHQARQSIHEKYIAGVQHHKAKYSMRQANVASTGYVGLNDRARSSKVYQLEELVGDGSMGFEYLAWDGIQSIPIVSDGRVMAVLVGQPPGSSWPSMAKEAADALERAHQRAGQPKTHRRGAFTALKCGVSYGGGRQKPGNMRNSRENAAILDELNSMEPFIRLAGFASSAMASWAPDLYEYYVSQLGALFARDPTLKRNFTSTVFTGASYNLGPRTACFPHKDFANLPFGWCSITALGSFNPKTSGHLVAWDCRLVIEFPPGSTILIPSATLSHSNVAVAEEETRFSFTQYSAGALFGWVDRGFQTVNSYHSSLSKAEKQKYARDNARRWKLGLSLLPHLKIVTSRSFK